LRILSKKLLFCIGLAMVMASPFSLRAETYLTQEQFIQNVFGSNVAKLETLWMTKEVAKQADKILGHAPKQLRQRYYKNGLQTAWILDEIGKEEPITAGFVVENGKIVQTNILAYRESRGWEVRHANFLKQYQGVGLLPDNFLNKNIDGISGATLSVRAMGKMARLALYFDQLSRTEIKQQEPAKP
jgi:FMN-binding domain